MPDVNLNIHSNILDVKKGVEQTTKATSDLEKETKDYEKASEKAFGQTADDLKDTSNAMNQMQPVTARLGNTFKALAGIFGAAFSVTAVVAFTKQVIASTDTTQDAMERFQMGIKSAFDYLKRTLATLDFSNLIQGFRDAYNAGKDFADQIDELEDRRRALSSQTKDIDLEIIRQRTLARNRALDLEDRKTAIEEIIRLENMKLEMTKSVTEQELKTQLDYAKATRDLSQEEILGLVTNYDTWKERLDQGAELQAQLDELMKMVMAFPEADVWSQEYYDLLNSLTDSQKENIRLYKEFGQITKDQRDAIAAAYNADKDAVISLAGAEETLQRIRNGLYSEFLSQEKEKGKVTKENAELTMKALEQELALRHAIFLATSDELGNIIPWYDAIEQKQEKRIENLIAEEKATQALTRALDEMVQQYRDEANVADEIDTEAVVKKIEEEQKAAEDLAEWKNANPGWAALGLDNDQQVQAIEQSVDEIVGLINQIVDAQVEATSRIVDDWNQRIDEQEQVVNRELEFKKEGMANNYELEVENLKKMQEARDEAIKEREKSVKLQRTISTIESGVALISAAANIMKGFSEIPIVGVILGLAAVAAMIAGFLSAKSQVTSATQLEEGGLITGPSHRRGGVRIPGTGIEVEGKEFVINKDSTEKYLPLIEAINADDRIAIDRAMMKANVNHVFADRDIDDSKKLGRIIELLERDQGTYVTPEFIIEKRGTYIKKTRLK